MGLQQSPGVAHSAAGWGGRAIPQALRAQRPHTRPRRSAYTRT